MRVDISSARDKVQSKVFFLIISQARSGKRSLGRSTLKSTKPSTYGKKTIKPLLVLSQAISCR